MALSEADTRAKLSISSKPKAWRLPGQQTFLSGFDDDWLADELANRLKGKILNERQVWEFVLTRTPCHLYKTAVNKLRKNGRVAPPTRTWPITFNRA